MKTEQIQLLRDVNEIPTSESIANGLGTAYDVYIKFLENLQQIEISLMDWRFYNDGKAWLTKGEYKWITKRGTHKVKPIFWLSIWESFFKISFFFSDKIRDELLALPITKETKEVIKKAKTMGKTFQYLPIIFDVSDEHQLNDLCILSNFRKDNI